MSDDEHQEVPVESARLNDSPTGRPRLQAVPAPTASPDPLEALYREHASLVYRVALRVCGRPADAEDVLQNVFLKLSRREVTIDPGMAPARYLARAATNTAIDLVRARGVRAAEPIDEAGAELAGGREDCPEVSAISRETRDRLRVALGRLHPRTAEIFALRFLEGYGNSEIATLLGTSPAVVAVSLFRAKGQLRRILAAAPGE